MGEVLPPVPPVVAVLVHNQQQMVVPVGLRMVLQGKAAVPLVTILLVVLVVGEMANLAGILLMVAMVVVVVLLRLLILGRLEAGLMVVLGVR
jgi:hypothetical protein